MSPHRPVHVPTAALWVIHAAFMSSIVIYTLLAWFLFLPMGRSSPLTLNPDMIFTLLAAVSVMQVFLGLFVFPQLGPTPADPVPAADYLVHRQARMVVSDAVIEAVGIYGLVGAAIGLLKNWQMLTIETIAFLGLVAMIPRVRGWLDEYGRRQGRDRGGRPG